MDTELVQEKIILFYDGDCALCNKTVQFAIDHEKENINTILFCSLQSDYAKQALEKYNYNFNQIGTFALLVGNNIFYKSEAALNLSAFLKKPYRWLIILKIIPKFIRDAIYDFVAKRRKRLIKNTFCYLPTSDVKNRFIE